MSGSPFKGKSLCVITGASRGYGKCIAEMFVTKLVPGSHLLLLARNTELLVQVTAQLRSLNKEVQVTWSEFDQSKLSDCSPENIEAILKKSCKNLGGFETFFLIHNAGSVGDLTKYSWEYIDADMLSSAVNTNLTGTFLLNASLLTEIRKHDYKHKVIVNISSLAALQPFASWSLYCAGKAARDMFFLTMAKEDPSLRVLNWAPGPLDTDMQAQCRQCADPTLREAFNDMYKNGKLLKCEESVSKLIPLLEENTFESGQHIDIYDV